MEFFDWLNISQILVDLFQSASSPGTLEGYMAQIRLNMAICLAIAGGIYLIVLILGGLGLSTLAKRAGLKRRYLAFLPFANTWYAGKLAGEAYFFGQKMKRAGLYAMLLEILSCAFGIFFIVVEFIFLNPEYFVLKMEDGVTGWSLDPALIPASYQWVHSAYYYLQIASYLIGFLVIVFLCVVFIAFFRKYFAKNPIMMTILCTILPCRGFAIFAVRKNAPVDYNEYMRRRAEEYARRRGPYGYGGPGGYPGPGYPGPGQGSGETPSQQPQSNPFPEFGGKSGEEGNSDDDPFSEFHG